MAAAPLDRMATACNLSKDQKKQFKAILDTAFKSAETLRKQIPLSHAQLGAAVLAGKSLDEIKTLADANGLMAAQIDEMEFKVFGQLESLLSNEQREAGAGRRLLPQVRGLLMKKNWDE